MLIPFKSKAAADFFMLDTHAKLLITAMGIDYAAQGVVRSENIALHLTQLTGVLNQDTVDVNDEVTASVGLKQRAWPLIDMLEKSQQKKVDLIWGSLV